MHDVENIEDQRPRRRRPQLPRRISATSIVMPIIINDAEIRSVTPRSVPGRHLRHVVNRPGPRTKLTHRPRHTMPKCRRTDRQLGLPGPAPCARRQCSAPSAGWKPSGSRVNPDPPPVVVSPLGAQPARSPPPGTRQAGQPHDPRLGDQPTVGTTLPPQAQKPWACTRSRLSFPDRLADVRSAVPSKSFGVDVRMVQPVDRVERPRRRQPKPARRTGRNAMPGLAPAAAPGLDPVELVVDGRGS